MAVWSALMRRAVIWNDQSADRYFGSWLIDLKRRKLFNMAVVAFENKIARIEWSVMTTHKTFEIRIQIKFAYDI